MKVYCRDCKYMKQVYTNDEGVRFFRGWACHKEIKETVRYASSAFKPAFIEKTSHWIGYSDYNIYNGQNSCIYYVEYKSLIRKIIETLN